MTVSLTARHYQLQLHNPIERIIINKLVEISIEERKARRPSEVHNPGSKMVNTSQKGDCNRSPNPSDALQCGRSCFQCSVRSY